MPSSRGLVGVGKVDDVDGVVLNLHRLCGVGALSLGGENLARHGADDIFRQLIALDARRDGKLLVVLVASDSREVVLLVLVEGVVDEDVRALDGGHFARTQTLEEVGLALLFRLAVDILLASRRYHVVVTEKRDELFVGAVTERAQERGGCDLPHAVDMHPLDVVLILFEFQPRAPVGDDRGLVARSAVAVERLFAVHAGAPDELADDDALRTVDDKRTRIRHEREIAHEHILLYHLARVVVGKAGLDLEGKRVSGVAVLALLDGVLGFTLESVGQEFQLQLAGEVHDGGIIPEDLFDAVTDEVRIRILLHLD